MSPFFATISRMKYIERWALMRNSRPENLSEHASEVAMIAHALCVIGNVRYNRGLNAERAALIGLYHDASEIITGDMPTPVKYYNDDLKKAYKEVEHAAEQRLLEKLPEDLRPSYDAIFHPLYESEPDELSGEGLSKAELSESDLENPMIAAAMERLYEQDAYARKLVKAADKLSALIKCIEESRAGNTEFRTAEESTRAAVDALCEELPEVRDFVREFLPSYGKTLDELL